MTTERERLGSGVLKRRSGTPRIQRSVTVEGRTVQEAIGKGLAILDAGRNQVSIRVLGEERRGLFGMRGAKPARVRLSLKPN